MECLLLAKCKMRCIGRVASPLVLVIPCFVTGLGLAKENMKASVVCACVDREWCIMWKENGIFSPDYL